MYRVYQPREGRSIIEATIAAVPNDGLRIAVIGQGGVNTREEWYFFASAADETVAKAIDDAASKWGVPVHLGLDELMEREPPPFAVVRNTSGLVQMLETLVQYMGTPQGPIEPAT